jgi:hypothetical protein
MIALHCSQRTLVYHCIVRVFTHFYSRLHTDTSILLSAEISHSFPLVLALDLLDAY